MKYFLCDLKLAVQSYQLFLILQETPWKSSNLGTQIWHPSWLLSNVLHVYKSPWLVKRISLIPLISGCKCWQLWQWHQHMFHWTLDYNLHINFFYWVYTHVHKRIKSDKYAHRSQDPIDMSTNLKSYRLLVDIYTLWRFT